MKTIQFAEYGAADVLLPAEADEPHAGPGEIRIAVRAAGVNPIDWKIRKGDFDGVIPLEFPAGIGFDAAGVIDEVGDGVSDVKPGDAVFGRARTSAAAEFAVLAQWTAKPARLSFEEAGGYPMATETARRGLKNLNLDTGQTLLVNGAAGGVGLAAVQFAIASGLTVIATAGTKNHPYLSELGAIPTEYGEGLVERVTALAPQGIDAAFDVAGFGSLPALIELTGSPRSVVTIADGSAAEHGVHFTSGGGSDSSPEAHAEAAKMFESGKFSLPVARAFGLHEAAAAHLASEQSHVLGKYVITVP